MNVIVTGGGGFLGSHTVKKLIKENHNVLVFSKNFENVKSCLNQCKTISGYIDELCIHEKEIINFSPDVVIHFGWSGGNNNADINESKQFFDNLPHSIKFLELLSRLDKKPKFIGVGSFAEYGNDPMVYLENYNEKPKDFYGLCKKMFREYSEMFCQQNSIDWTWIRPCFIYGPNDVSTRLIPKVINKMIKSELVHLDDCEIIIDYLYIDDFSDLVYELIITKNVGIYNICSGKKYILKDVINKIKELTNSKSKLMIFPGKKLGSLVN